jgi:hypothetical protein
LKFGPIAQPVRSAAAANMVKPIMRDWREGIVSPHWLRPAFDPGSLNVKSGRNGMDEIMLVRA